jgi:hypothetical protein
VERFVLDLEAPLSPMEIERQYIRPLKYLIALATGEFCDVESFQVAQAFHSDERFRDLWYEVEPYRGRWEPFVPRGVDSASMLFTLDQYEFAELIPQWFDLVELCGPTIDLIFALDGPGNVFVSNRLFNAVAAVEGLHQQLYPESRETVKANQKRVDRIAKKVDDIEERKWLRSRLAGSHRPFLRERLQDLLSLAGSAMEEVIGNSEAWIRRVKNLRDLIGHGASVDESDLSVQVRLTTSLELLYRAILLRRIGFEDAECRDRIMASLNWSYLPAAMRHDVPEIFSEPDGSSNPEAAWANTEY